MMMIRLMDSTLYREGLFKYRIIRIVCKLMFGSLCTPNILSNIKKSALN